MDEVKLYGKDENEVDSLVQTVRIFGNDVGMNFGINKCAVRVMKRDRMVKSVGIELPNERRLRALGEDDDGYNYLGVL